MHRACPAAPILFVALAAPLPAQETLLGVEACEPCSSPLVAGRTIPGDGGGLELASSPWSVALDGRGRTWISMPEAATISVFESSGRFVASVGRRGEGPGEFLSPGTLVPIGDSVLVFDPVQARGTMVGPDLVPGRNFSFPGQVFEAAVLAWPRVAINAVLRTPGGRGRPYHILDVETGQAEVSFGESSGDYPPTQAPALMGQLFYDEGSETLWTVSRADFTVQQWSPDGALLRALTVPERVFPSGGSGWAGNRDTPPDPLVMELLVRPSGELLVLYSLAREDWQRAWRDVPRDPHGPGAGDLPAGAELWDRKLAIIHPDASSITTGYSFEGRPVGFAHTGGFVTVRAVTLFTDELQFFH